MSHTFHPLGMFLKCSWWFHGELGWCHVQVSGLDDPWQVRRKQENALAALRAFEEREGSHGIFMWRVPVFFVGGCKGGKPCPENNPPIEVGLLRSWLQQFGDGLVGVPFPMVPPSIVTLLRFAKEFDRLGRERDAMLAKMGHPVGFGDKMPGRSFFYCQALGQRAPLQQVVGPVPWSHGLASNVFISMRPQLASQGCDACYH